MDLNDWAIVIPLFIAGASMVGGAIAWLSRWGRQAGEDQRQAAHDQAEAAKIMTDTAVELVQLREAINGTLKEDWERRGQRLAILEAQVLELLPLKEEIEGYRARVLELERELDKLRPYPAKVRALERELAETRLALQAAEQREEDLKNRIRKLERETGPLTGKK